MERLEHNKAITLIALVITIIVLLILAGITIMTLTGENGLLNRSTLAREKHEISADIETLKLEYNEYNIEKVNWYKSKTFLEYLEEKGYIVDYTSDTKKSGTVILNGRVYEIREEEELKIEYKGEASGDALLRPKITKLETIVNNSEATVNIELEDKKGVTLKYIIQKDGEDEIIEETSYIEDLTYTFNDLEISTTYIVTVEAKNEYGTTIRKATIKTISLSDLTAGKASFEITPNTKWQAEVTAKIISSYSDTDTILQYKIEDGEWNDYTEEFKVETNGTLSGRFYHKTTEEIGYTFTLKVDVIDDVKPNIEITEQEVGSRTIKLTVSANDNELGMPSTIEYKYYIGTSESDYTLKDTLTTNSYTYEDLSPNITYLVKITATDKAGNEGEVLKTITTITPILVSDIKLDKTSVTIGTADTVELHATITPSNAEDKTVKWTTSDPSIATVSDTGLVTPLKAGNVTITCSSTDGGATANCEVKIANGSLIYTRTDLEGIAINPSGSYTLMQDIDLSGSNWTPISEFSGTLDGQGYKISNLVIEESEGTGNSGLFRKLVNATIQNIKIENSSITKPKNYVGFIAGSLSGSTIQNVGIKNSNIDVKYNASALRAGGLFGKSGGGNNIKDCYFIGGDVSSTGTNGYRCGIIGDGISSDSIENCYAVVTSNSLKNPIDKGSSVKTNCYYDSIISSGSYTPTDGITGLSTDKFADSSNFSGWDFEDTWIIKDGVPELRVFLKDET